MLIELIIEFKWKGRGPPGRTCTPTTDYFHDKIGICKKNHRLSYYLLLKYCSIQCISYFPCLGQITEKIGPQNARL